MRASACEYRAEGRGRDYKAERSKRERGHMRTFARSSHHAAVALARHRGRACHLERCSKCTKLRASGACPPAAGPRVFVVRVWGTSSQNHCVSSFFGALGPLLGPKSIGALCLEAPGGQNEPPEPQTRPRRTPFGAALSDCFCFCGAQSWKRGNRHLLKRKSN